MDGKCGHCPLILPPHADTEFLLITCFRHPYVTTLASAMCVMHVHGWTSCWSEHVPTLRDAVKSLATNGKAIPRRHDTQDNGFSMYIYRRHHSLNHCATSWKVAGSIPDGVIGSFHLHNPSGRTMALGSTQPLTEMSTRNISWAVKAAGA